MVGPQNLKPRAASSFDMARDTAVSAGIWLRLRKWLIFGRPSRNPHSSLEKPGPFSITSSQAGARGGDRTIDLGAVAHDAGVAHQRPGLALAVAGNHGRLEAVKRAAEVL